MFKFLFLCVNRILSSSCFKMNTHNRERLLSQMNHMKICNESEPCISWKSTGVISEHEVGVWLIRTIAGWKTIIKCIHIVCFGLNNSVWFFFMDWNDSQIVWMLILRSYWKHVFRKEVYGHITLKRRFQ